MKTVTGIAAHDLKEGDAVYTDGFAWDFGWIRDNEYPVLYRVASTPTYNTFTLMDNGVYLSQRRLETFLKLAIILFPLYLLYVGLI